MREKAYEIVVLSELMIRNVYVNVESLFTLSLNIRGQVYKEDTSHAR